MPLGIEIPGNQALSIVAGKRRVLQVGNPDCILMALLELIKY